MMKIRWANCVLVLALACASDPETTPRPPDRTPPPAATRAAGAGLEARCDGRTIDVGPSVMGIATDFEGRRLAYDAALMQDCSGMLHQALGRFERIGG